MEDVTDVAAKRWLQRLDKAGPIHQTRRRSGHSSDEREPKQQRFHRSHLSPK
jgi:hypothetical protein